ncbi:MAG: FtsX-like permease family protein [Nitrospiraceae bacterium]|nr:FtsX-like permease family protein [Nitrospiraceae bacterium]
MKHSTLRMAWRNLGRSKRRTWLAIGAIALGQLTLVSVNGLMAGSFDSMLQAVTGPMVGHVQIHHKDWREERAVDLYLDRAAETVAQIQALPQVTGVTMRLFAPALVASGEVGDAPSDAEPGIIMGVDVAKESGKGGMLETLGPKELPGEGAVAIGKVLANRLGVSVGESLAVIGQDVDGFPTSDLFEITGFLGGSVDLVKTMGIMIPYADAAALLAMPDQTHEIVIQGEDYEQAASLAASVAALPLLKDAEVLTWREAVPQIARIVDLKGWMDFIFVAIVFVAAAAGIANTAVMSTFERTHEFGMLLAVGARPGRIVAMVVIESVILGLVGVLIGSVLGSAVVLLTSHTGVNYAAFGSTAAEDVSFAGVNISYIVYPVFELRNIVFGVWAVTLTSVLASLWPAVIASRLEPVEAMRK